MSRDIAVGWYCRARGHANSAFGRDDALEPLVARQPKEDARVVRVVLDDQQNGIAVVDVAAVILDLFLARKRQQYGERARCRWRPRPWRALQQGSE